jgi:hypothetical protein
LPPDSRRSCRCLGRFGRDRLWFLQQQLDQPTVGPGLAAVHPDRHVALIHHRAGCSRRIDADHQDDLAIGAVRHLQHFRGPPGRLQEVVDLVDEVFLGVGWYSWDVAGQILVWPLPGVNPYEDHSAIGVGVGSNDLDELWRDLPLVLNDTPFAYLLIEKILQQLGRDLFGCGRTPRHCRLDAESAGPPAQTSCRRSCARPYLLYLPMQDSLAG